MSVTVAFDVYPAATPNGTRLVRLLTSGTGTKQSVEMACRKVLHGSGEGMIRIHSDHAAATSANFAKRNYVKVVLINGATETEWFGFFMETGEFAAVDRSERGGRMLTFSGPGSFYYLDRAVLLESIYAPGQPRRGSGDVDGSWWWSNQPYGAITTRALEEGFNQPGSPLAHATWDFTRTLDSAAVAWPTIANEYKVPWGTKVYDLLGNFIKLGLTITVDADLTFHAWQTYGTNRTSATFAANKIRFAHGVNIGNDVTRKINANLERSHVFVAGDDLETVVVSGGSSAVTYYDTLDRQDTNDAATLTVAGQHNLDAREIQADSAVPVRVIIADDELNGRYVPGEHYDVGDIATIHTVPPGAAASPHDYNNFAIEVAAIKLEHDDAGNWFAVNELGAQYLLGQISSAFEERSSRVINQVELCRIPGATVNLVCGAARGNLVSSGEASSQWMELAADCNDATGWGSNGFPVANQHWGIDLLSSQTASSWRILHPGTPGNSATAAIIWATNDAAKWAAIGAPPYDFAAAGWTSVATLSGLGLDSSGSFTAATYRYWVFDATAGGGNGWSVNEFALNTPPSDGDGHADLVGTSIRATRCDHKHHVLRTTAPTVNDDSGDGYPTTTLWTNTVTGRTYVLTVATVGAAVWVEVGAATSAPTTADYLVGTAQAGLSAEIVVGTTPGGELGNTWASPTVDATHAGSNHLQPVRKNSAGTVFERRRLNLIEGSNVTLTVADDSGNDEVDITIASSGGASGVTVQDEGTPLATDGTTLNFVGAGVTATGAGATKTITIPGGGSSSANPYAQADIPPASPDAQNEEFDTAFTVTPTFVSSSGTATSAALMGDALADDSGPVTNPPYNVDSDIQSNFVMQALNGGKLYAYWPFAPSSGTEWCVVAKMRLFNPTNIITSECRLIFGVSAAAPTTAAGEAANSIGGELRTISLGLRMASIRPATRTNDSDMWTNSPFYVAIAGVVDNSISIYVSQDGMTWRRKERLASGTSPAGGLVANVWVYLHDVTGTGQGPIAMVDFIRYNDTDSNFFTLMG